MTPPDAAIRSICVCARRDGDHHIGYRIPHRFFLMELVPGDCAERYLAFKNTQGSSIQIANALEAERVRLGLDQPFLFRWGSWIVNAFQGEFGDSCILRVNIAQLLGDKFWLSLGLCLASLLLAYAIAIPVGIISVATNLRR